ncbi:MAG: hypothetical protein EOO03_08765 [Chitinophagaceae bacterium]|nr:MAG: hypothetical protein EOO03_08765 [Chitinophagaceae bacterium]
MKQYKKYIHFINGRYVNEGVRITAGILLPSFVMNYFDMLPVGFVISLGALCVSVADTPGAVKHRLNGMLACCLLVAAAAAVVHYATASNLLFATLITLAGFFCSMLTVYGNRASAVGIAVLIVLVLSLQTPLTGIQIWYNAGYILAGGVWYMLYSLLLYRLRPYKFIQQVLADYVFEVATYLKLRGDLYGENPNYEKINRELLQQQVSIEAQQNMLGDLLFNTRNIVKESTHVGRVLVKTYLEVADLYESVMTTYQQYALLHEQFDSTGILRTYREIIYALSAEMEEISLALKSGVSSAQNDETQKLVVRARELFELLRQDYMADNNVEHFVSLGRIQNNLQGIAEKISQLHRYTTYEVKVKKTDSTSKTLAEMKPDNDIRPSLFFSNLNFQSNIFRHSVRVSLALLVGYIVSLLFKTDHGYWILLTILVILKPAYSLTKKRNVDRLIGTAAGIVVGLLVLILVKNGTALLVIMIFFMTSSYMFMRTNYFWNVLLMTTYIVIFFHYLHPGNIEEIMLERIIDTAIGSVIAFFASLFIIPAWERNSISTYMIKMLEASISYFSKLAGSFAGNEPEGDAQLQLLRRELLVALANLSDAFTRMLSEPKRYQGRIKTIHRFVSVNHTLVSHMSSLSYLLQTENNSFRSPQLTPVIENTILHFKNAIHFLQQDPGQVESPDSAGLQAMNDLTAALLQARKEELAAGKLETPLKKQLVETKSVIDQFNFIYSNAAAICKLSKDHDAAMLSN